jgi:hypothetical protein
MSFEKYRDSFITYNIKESNNDVEVEIINVDMPDDNVLFLVGKDLKYLWDLDIKNFNYIIFENDLENINDNEFEYFWNKFFIPWIERLNENYIEIDLEKFKFQLTNTYEKKFLIKKFAHFLMMFFPYYIIKNIFQNNSVEELAQAYRLIDYWKENPEILRQEFRIEFEKVSNKSKNLLNSLTNLLQFTKKGELEHSIELLERQLTKQEVYLKLFLEFIEQTESDKIINLIKTYVNNDFENLI